jgi:hypothetical protein
MPAAADQAIAHFFTGGFATDYGGMAEIELEGNRIKIPFLTRCENFHFELNGSIHKIGGTSKYNSVTIESGEEIRGMFEYVRHGTLGTLARRRIVHAGTKILKDDNDGTFTSIFTGLENDTVPNYVVCEDSLIISSSSTVDVPKKWDQTTAADLGGSPPNFSFSVVHAGRLWAAGNAALPSRLYYSSLQNFEEWNSAGDSGVINIDPNDGDSITGIYPFRGALIVFKGGAEGSIHIISGRTPATFARDQLSRGVGCAWQNTIFPLWERSRVRGTGRDDSQPLGYGQVRRPGRDAPKPADRNLDSRPRQYPAAEKGMGGHRPHSRVRAVHAAHRWSQLAESDAANGLQIWRTKVLAPERLRGVERGPNE